VSPLVRVATTAHDLSSLLLERGFADRPALRWEGVEGAIRAAPMRRAARPDEVAEAVAFLASPAAAAAFITGQVLSRSTGVVM
jgi:NAD(P)-dependent dehydrogenase (short-subunit alcohol dehydrogenase family)